MMEDKTTKEETDFEDLNQKTGQRKRRLPEECGIKTEKPKKKKRSGGFVPIYYDLHPERDE